AQGAPRYRDHGRPSPGAHVAARQARGAERRRARSLRPGRGGGFQAARRRMSTLKAAPLASLLGEGGLDAPARRELRARVYAFVIPLVAAAVLMTLWSATAPLSGAIIAPAQVKVELNRKARAAAEIALAPRFAPPREEAASEHAAREVALFAARRRTLDEQVASL